MFEAPGSKGEV